MEKKISQLRTFFRVSNAAFEFQNSIQLAFSGHIVPTKMQQLHKMALVEIEKESPDLSKIDNLLAEMENLAELNSQTNNQIRRMNWKNAKTEEPNFDHINYLVIVKVGGDYVYAFAYWDGEKWIYSNAKDAEIVAFTETDPKTIAVSL